MTRTSPAAVAGGAAVERPLKGSCETTFVPMGIAPGPPPVQTLEITLTCRLTHLGLTGGAATQLVLPGVVIDDWFFGVSSISEDGYESPVVFPGPPGAFVSVGDPASPAR